MQTIELNPSQLQSIYDTNMQRAQAITSNAQQVCNDQFVFFAAFDGTNNDKDNAPAGEQSTNVWQLIKQSSETENFIRRYYPGPGTEGSLRHSSWLPPAASSTRQDNPLDVPAAIRDMPNIAGMGNVGSLWQVMAQEAQAGSSHLKDLARQALTVKIIYAWAGVEDKDPMSRAATKVYTNNPIGDARKLYAMEALLGEGYEGTWCWNEKVGAGRTANDGVWRKVA